MPAPSKPPVLTGPSGSLRSLRYPGRIENGTVIADQPDQMEKSDSSLPLVLFADDDAALHELVGGLLSSHGYRVDCQSNGSDALSSFRKRGHDAIITDLMMPEMNGYEFMRELKAIDRTSPERTIILTGASMDTWRWFDQKSVAAFLTKPVDLLLLLEELGKCVGR